LAPLRTEVSGGEGKEKSTRYEIRRTRMEEEKFAVLRESEKKKVRGTR
jgi:hypothetical protein